MGSRPVSVQPVFFVRSVQSYPAPAHFCAMPPAKNKVNHRKGGGSKHVSSVEDVKARNEGKETAYDKARRERRDGKDESGDEGEGEKKEEKKPEVFEKVKKSANPMGAVENPNAGPARDVMKEGVELSRKQKEELEKAAATRRYQEMHKAGETDEAKADLGRLKAVKERREAEKKAREEKEEAEKEKAAKAASEDKPRGAMERELKDIMGKEGKKSKKDKKEKKDKDDDEASGDDKDKKKDKKEKEKTWQEGIAGSKGDAGSKKTEKNKTTGTIEECRAIEEDFM